LFSLVFIFGCISGPSDQTNVNESTGEVAKGTFSANILVNGKGTDTISLLSQQSAQIGLQIRNSGDSELKNVKALVVGCIDGVATKNNASIITVGGQDYFSWTVTAPSLSQSEVINCPITIRVCYDKVSKGYTELKFIPEQYTEAPEPPTSYSDSDVLSLSFNFPVIRVLCNTTGSTCNVNPNANEISGSLTITNIGPGWIDYTNYSTSEGLAINTIRGLRINVTADKVKIIKLRDVSGLRGWLSNEDRTLNLTTSKAGTEISLLRLVQGKDLYLPIRLNVTDSLIYQSEPKTETLNVEVDHGYCVDLAQLSATLRGR